MTLAELLNYLRGSVLNDRTSRVSGASDYLWTDADLITNINEAQRRFASRSLILRDGTTDAVTKVTLAEGQDIYELHASVLGVISGSVVGQPNDLNRVGHAFLAAQRATSENWVDPRVYFGRAPGPTLAFSTDEDLSPDSEGSLANVTLRIYPKPTAREDGNVLRLRVVRKPIRIFTVADLEDPTAIPEIPVDHHIEMLDWAAYLALRIVDDDAGVPARAIEFMNSFEAHVQSARVTAMRKLFAPMDWGFGRGGFSWSR